MKIKVNFNLLVVVGAVVYIGTGVPGLVSTLKSSSPTTQKSVPAKPTAKSKVADSQKVQFIKQMYAPALELQKRRGIPAQVTIAIAIIESGAGQYKIGQHNYFGLKARKKQRFIEKETTEVIDGQKKKVKAKFRDCETLRHCLDDVADRLISYTRKDGLPDEVWMTEPLKAIESMYERWATDDEYQAKLESNLVEVNDVIEDARTRELEKVDATGYTFVLAPGHTIHPGVETGATGERDMNILITDILTQKLRKVNAKVLRPDKELDENGNLKLKSWFEYMSYGEKHVRSGAFWAEPHGQPFIPDPVGKPNLRWGLGAICNPANVFCQQLSKDSSIGYLELGYEGWNNYYITKRGGALLEAYHTDLIPQSAAARLIFAEDKAQDMFNGIMEAVRLENQKK